MQKIEETCPVCLTDTFVFLYHSTYNNFNLPIYVCERCGLQTIIPKTEMDPKELYSESYYTGKAEYAYRDERKTEHYDAYVWDARIRNIKKFVKSGNFLDVGSSFGGFLERARIAGFSVFGVEVSPYSSEYSRKRNLEVFTGEYLKNPYPENFFDVITLVEVLEHLPEPRKVLEKIFAQLRSGGIVLLQTANFEGMQAKESGCSYHYYLPGHLYYFSKMNLETLLYSVGFSSTKMYFGVDFPLIAKLLKSRGSFTGFNDYAKWWTISKYHMKSILSPGSTSSMVLYGFKQ